MNSKTGIHELLGDPPWDEEILRKCYFRNFTETREFIQDKHPGTSVYANLESIRLSLEIFLNAEADLISSINRFKGESDRPGFWDRPSRQHVESLEISIQRGIASSAMCAMALKDHSLKFSAEFPIIEYDNMKNHYFIDNEEHCFVQCLRNYISHFKITRANWTVTHSLVGDGRKVSFIFSYNDLLKWNKWRSLAKLYIKKHPKGINVEELFEHYSTTVSEFHNWLRSAIMNKYGDEISDYLRYLRLMNRFASQSHWNILISQVFIPKKIDPYMYLDRYVTRQELENVLSLPHRSKEQVDCIIELVDEYNACTEEIRNLVYEFFNVK